MTSYFRRQDPVRVATVWSAVRISEFRGNRLNNTLKAPFRTPFHTAPISLGAFPHSSFGGPDPSPWPAGQRSNTSMEMPRFYGPSLPGGSGPRSSRATPALPYLRGSGRRRRRLRGASLQPPGGRQRRDQEKPEGEQGHSNALHLGLARSSGRQYREGRIGPRGSWGRGLEGGAGL